MTTDLSDEIREFMERGLHHVSAAEAVGRTSQGKATFPAGRFRPRTRRTRWAVLAAGTAAIACAGGLVAAQLSGPGSRALPHTGHPAAITAAYLRHLASASRVALAQAGHAMIVSQTTQDGVSQGTSTSDITFSGRNWNDSFSEVLPASDGAGGTTQSAVNRVVGGQAYDYFVAARGLAWYHDTGPNAIASMAIPDPRQLLGELSPAAGFVQAGTGTVAGVQVEHLRATDLSGLPSIQLGNDTPDGQLMSLDIWADSAGVVRRMSVTTSQTASNGYFKILPKATVGEIKALRKRGVNVFQITKSGGQRVTVELTTGGTAHVVQTTVTVTFLDIGQHQIIRAPAHSYHTYGRG
jgi:hypothetical protein